MSRRRQAAAVIAHVERPAPASVFTTSVDICISYDGQIVYVVMPRQVRWEVYFGFTLLCEAGNEVVTAESTGEPKE
jgi:hypothetical protein